ncbi:MAG: hypothetical protein M3025_04020 [Actinomycetota bacterium]|nr:hypothetical protein [Actinomycetota bacterium]
MCARETSMDQVQAQHESETQFHAAMDAACEALISLERTSALPEMQHFPDVEFELARAKESLREAIRGLRLAGTAEPSVQELDFVLPRRPPSPFRSR